MQQALQPISSADKSSKRIRRRRYDLHNVACGLLPFSHRTRFCSRHAAPTLTPTLAYSLDKKRAKYTNLALCDNAWTCPICSANRSQEEKNRLQLLADVAMVEKRGLIALTFTNSHHAGQSLTALVKAQNRAMARFWRGAPMRRWLDRIALSRATVKTDTGTRTAYAKLYATEITHGANGWHPHRHYLLILDKNLTEDLFADFVNWCKDRWVTMCAKEGLHANYTHGLDGANGAVAYENVMQYAAKGDDENALQSASGTGWYEAANELALAHTKLGRWHGRTPLQLLDDAGRGDHEAGRLWQEFAAAMKGVHRFNGIPDSFRACGLSIEEADAMLEEKRAESEDTYAEVIELDDDTLDKLNANRLRVQLLEFTEQVKGDGVQVRSWLDFVLTEEMPATRLNAPLDTLENSLKPAQTYEPPPRHIHELPVFGDKSRERVQHDYFDALTTH